MFVLFCFVFFLDEVHLRNWYIGIEKPVWDFKGKKHKSKYEMGNVKSFLGGQSLYVQGPNLFLYNITKRFKSFRAMAPPRFYMPSPLVVVNVGGKLAELDQLFLPWRRWLLAFQVMNFKRLWEILRLIVPATMPYK